MPVDAISRHGVDQGVLGYFRPCSGRVEKPLITDSSNIIQRKWLLHHLRVERCLGELPTWLEELIK